MAVEPILDPERIATLQALGQAANDPSLLSAVLQMFLKTTPERLTIMQKACEACDLDTLRRESHSMKGSAATIGATRMCSISRELESSAKQAITGNLQRTLDRLKGSFELVKLAVEPLVH